MKNVNQSKYFKIREEYHGCAHCFDFKIDWNASAIADDPQADGYIVQHVEWKTVGSPIGQLSINKDYYEAWKVTSGDICKDGSQPDDTFSVFQGELSDEIRAAIGSSGTYVICSTVYWIPHESDLFDKVDSWGHDVRNAGNLKSSFHFEDLSDQYLVFFREPFEHSWSLIGDEEIIAKVSASFAQAYSDKIRNHNCEFIDGWVASVLATCSTEVRERTIEKIFETAPSSI